MLFVGLLFAAPATFEESFRAGLIALQHDDLRGAEANLTAAAKLSPNNGRVWVALARTYWKLGDSGRAGDAAVKASTRAAQDSVVFQSLAIYYAESGQTLKAADTQAKYSALKPLDRDAHDRAVSLYFEAAQPLLKREAFGDAIAILRAAKTSLGENAQIELALGVAYYGLRRYDEAAAAFLSTIAVAPEIEQPYIFLGKMLDQIPDRLPEVTKRFVEFEAAHKESATGYLLHAKALDAQPVEPGIARSLLEKAISINESEASAHFELGTLLASMKDFGASAAEFERAAALDPTDPATHYRLSRVYEKLGKHEAALTEREQHARLVKAQDSAR